MELRERISLVICENANPDRDEGLSLPYCVPIADAILAIPEIAEALALALKAEVDALKLGPSV